MNRKLKNIITILIIIIISVLSFFTMKSANNAKNTFPGAMGTPPEMSGSTGKSENGMPPARPDSNSDNKDEKGTPPDMPEQDKQGENNNTPPAKPGENNSSEQTNQEQSENTREKPNENGQIGKSGENSNMPDDNRPKGMPNRNAKNVEIATIYYILFIVEALAISVLIAYLIMSNFNKKTIKETLNEKIKIILYIAIVVVLTTGLTFLQVYLTKNVITGNSQPQGELQMPGGNMNESSANITYTATKEITEDTTLDNETFSSTSANENGVLVNGEVEANLSNITVNKSGDSDGGDTSSFYGNNSAILAKSKANVILKNANITTNASGANGVFSYGGSATTNNSTSDGTTVNISDSKITTTGDNAGGIMTTGGGKTVASNLTINTSGTSSAAIRTDRGGGTVTVDKGTYTTKGQGSPTVYSTADVTVNNADLIAEASEGIVIEGANSVTLNTCNLTDNNTKLNGQSTTYKNIFLYQSMSGDASNGTAKFTAKDSNILTNKGDSFYITNTTATINLTNNKITNNDSAGNFLRAQKDSWGKSGANGGNVTLVMNNQNAIGNIVVDSISTLDMTMEEGSYYEGTINGENEAESISLKLDSSSKIKLTGDSYISSLEDEDTSYSNIDCNGFILYVNGTAVNK